MHSSSPSQQEAAQELLNRRNARRKLLDFTQYTFPNYQVDDFHVHVAEALDRVVSGECKRLMIFAPPQHGKSELVSVRLPAFWLAKNPDSPVILASYATDLAKTHSRQARDVVESNEFKALFGDLSPYELPIETRDDSRAVHEWQLAAPARGGLRAVGVSKGLTGHPGMLGIIDDPHADWEEAQSPTMREKAFNWYRSVFRTRIWEGGAIVIIMTRWHEDDLAGKLLKSQPEQWEVLRFPALAESQEERDLNDKFLNQPIGQPDPLGRKEGEPLAPNRFSKAALIELKTDLGSVIWSAEYQGVPRPSEGSRFKRSWFPIVDAVPAHAKRARYWDKAGTAKGQGTTAHTAGVLIAIHEGIVYVEHVVRGQWSSGEREKVIKQTAEVDAIKYSSPTVVDYYVEQEPGSGGKESAENTIKNLAGYSIQADRPTGDKDTRLEPFAAQAEAMNVRLLRGDWNYDYIEELVTVPNGVFRDQSDASAGAFNKLTLGKKDAPPEYRKVKVRR